MYGKLYYYFIIYYNVIMIEIKCTIHVMRLNHPETIPPHPPSLWNNCLPRNRSLVPKRSGTSVLEEGGDHKQTHNHTCAKHWLALCEEPSRERGIGMAVKSDDAIIRSMYQGSPM